MPLQPIAKRSVPDEVFDQIAGDVLRGDLAPGEALPSERRLAEVLSVSRSAVREALQRLAHAGFVEVRQGDATTVRDFARHAGPDLLPQLLTVGGQLNLDVARSVLEARAHIGPFIAGLAAERGGARLKPALDAAVAAIADAADGLGRQRAALEFWEHLIDGADSIAFRLMYNSLRAAYEPAMAALTTVLDVEVSGIPAYAAVTAAVAKGDRKRATAAADRLLRPGTDALLHAIEELA